jgi:hypothetical protein
MAVDSIAAIPIAVIHLLSSYQLMTGFASFAQDQEGEEETIEATIHPIAKHVIIQAQILKGQIPEPQEILEILTTTEIQLNLSPLF